MSRQLILVRHSLPEIREDLPAREWHLSDEGKRRAARLADALDFQDFGFLASSLEPKALETAQIIATKWAVELHVVQGLHEHERSAVPYLSKSEFESSVREFFEKPDTLVFGSETANEAYERFSQAVCSILAEKENRNIVLVSHGTVISLFVSRLTGGSGFQIWSGLGLPGFIILDMQSSKMVAFENIL